MEHRRRISREQEQEVLRMYAAGQTHSQIARSFGVHRNTIGHLLWRNGQTKTKPGRKSLFSLEEKLSIRAYYELGTSQEAIAALWSVAPQTIARVLRELGVVCRPAGFQPAEHHHAWRGGKCLRSDGYVLQRITSESPFFSMAQKKVDGHSYILEHRLVMAVSLGRVLRDSETVHHIDGNKQNNALSNLQLRQSRHGAGIVLQCADCGSHNVTAVEISDAKGSS